MPRAEPRELHRLANAIVHIARRIGDQRGFQRAEPVEPHILLLRRAMTGDEKRQEVGHGGAGDENPGRIGREAERLRHPSADLALDVERDVIASAAIGVEAARQHFGDHAGRGSGALNPAHEHRMPIAHREGRDIAPELLERAVDILAFSRRGAAKKSVRLLARGAPNRRVAEPANIVDHRIERAMGLDSERVPVPRIEVAGGGVLGPWRGLRHKAPPYWQSRGLIESSAIVEPAEFLKV